MTRNLYRITARAPSSVIFRKGEFITINYGDDNAVRLHLSTRYLERGFSVPVPGDFAVVIEAESSSPNEAITWVTAGREIASIISLAANAAINPLEGELVYEITPGKEERDFFQRYVPPDQGGTSSRLVPLDTTLALIQAVGHHEHRDRLLRATTQYTEALLRWAMGNELLVISHLWMGIEAVSKADLRLHLKKNNIREQELATQWGFNPNGTMKLATFLETEARVNLTCQGDRDHYKIAKEVSDKFEHGLANGGALFSGARDALMPISRYLREAIFRVAEISDEHFLALLSDPYDVPRGPGRFDHYMHGKLIGGNGALSAEGFDHPFCEWKNGIKDVTLNEATGVYSYIPDYALTARVGVDVQLSDLRFEIWDGGIFTPKSAAEVRATESVAGMKDSSQQKQQPVLTSNRVSILPTG